MKRPLPLLFSFALALASCTSPNPTPASADGEADSSMVVASEERVPSAERPTVVFLGTSLTAGFGLADPDESYVARLQAIGDSVGVPFRAVNAGVSGETSAGGLRRVDWVLREPVDVLVIELGANDGLRGQDPGAMATNLSEIIDRARARHPGVRILLAGMEAPPNLGERYTSEFRQVFTDVAREKDVTLIPFLLEGVAGVTELNQGDRIHPTAEGHRLIARIVWPFLEDMLDIEGGAR